MKSLTEFLQQVLIDMGTWCRTSTTQDFKTVLRRIEHEGLSFLTITLSSFGKDLEKGLDQGYVDHTMFAGFDKRRGTPRFLGGFLDLVFDPETGLLLTEPSVEAIRCLRQFTLMWAKINLPCTDARRAAAIRRYVECEQEVRDADASVDPDRVHRYTRIGRLLWSDVFSRVDQQVFYGEVVPKHGPGNTAERLKGNLKWSQQEWTERLEQVFPHWEYLVRSWSLIDRLADVQILAPADERPVRVVDVPKTLSTPRIIALEPTCMQYMQQGLLGSILESVEGCDIPRRIIGWTSQVPNQRLALQGSRDGTLATLDLREASDRVSNQHVRILLGSHPHLQGAVDACRSRKADVPGHGVIRLAKFASMGSALCFPFEAMVFATIVFVGIEEGLKRPLTGRDIESLSHQVRVFGDDIIVPKDYVHHVISALEDFGLRVNTGKSFWSGNFRESCGKEYYGGEDVTITRLRTLLPASRADVSEIVSCVSTMNQLYQHGLWRSAAYLHDLLSGLIPLPVVSETSPLLGFHSFLGPERVIRKLCPDLHHPLVTGARVKSNRPASQLDDYGALQKCLTLSQLSHSNVEEWSTIFGMPAEDVEHLERSGRPRVVSIKLGMGPTR